MKANRDNYTENQSILRKTATPSPQNNKKNVMIAEKAKGVHPEGAEFLSSNYVYTFPNPLNPHPLYPPPTPIPQYPHPPLYPKGPGPMDPDPGPRLGGEPRAHVHQCDPVLKRSDSPPSHGPGPGWGIGGGGRLRGYFRETISLEFLAVLKVDRSESRFVECRSF